MKSCTSRLKSFLQHIMRFLIINHNKTNVYIRKNHKIRIETVGINGSS